MVGLDSNVLNRYGAQNDPKRHWGDGRLQPESMRSCVTAIQASLCQRTEQRTGRAGGTHHKCTPDQDTHCSAEDGCTARTRRECPKRGEKNEREGCDDGNEDFPGRKYACQKRNDATKHEADRRRRGCLQRPGRQRFGDANVIPRVGPEGIVGHELPSDLYGEFVIETAQDIDVAQFYVLGVIVMLQCASFDVEVSAFRIGLGANRYILASAHRECPGDESGKPRDQDSARAHVRRRNAEQQAGDRQHAVIRAEYACAEPSGSVSAVNM